METKYYTINIHNQNKSRVKRQHKRILRRRIRCACAIIGFLSFVCLLGAVGSLEQNVISISQFAIYGAISILVFAVSAEIYDRI